MLRFPWAQQHDGPDKYLVLKIRDFTLHLIRGCYEVEMFPDDIITPYRLFEFIRMPFGLFKAGSTFQHMIDRILAGLPFIFVYLECLGGKPLPWL